MDSLENILSMQIKILTLQLEGFDLNLLYSAAVD